MRRVPRETEREREGEAKARSFRWLLLIPTTSMSPVIDSDKYNRTARVIGIIDVEWKRVEQKRSCTDQPIIPIYPFKEADTSRNYDLWSSNWDQSKFSRQNVLWVWTKFNRNLLNSRTLDTLTIYIHMWCQIISTSFEKVPGTIFNRWIRIIRNFQCFSRNLKL